MNEQVLATAIWGDESEALLSVKPLHGTNRHFCTPCIPCTSKLGIQGGTHLRANYLSCNPTGFMPRVSPTHTSQRFFSGETASTAQHFFYNRRVRRVFMEQSGISNPE